MGRLLPSRSHSTQLAARHEWVVSAGGALDPAELVDRLGAIASDLVRELVGRPVQSSGLEQLTIFSAVGPGERLVATLALERPSREAGRWPVSIVVRRGAGAGNAVAVAGVLVFVLESAAAVAGPHGGGQASRGHAVVRSSFLVTRGEDWLVKGNLLRWVQASALVSAQGLQGALLRALGFEAVTLRGPIEDGERLELACSVVRQVDGVLSVLCEVRSERGGHEVLVAVSRFAP